jgi:hypothetical protein
VICEKSSAAGHGGECGNSIPLLKHLARFSGVTIDQNDGSVISRDVKPVEHLRDQGASADLKMAGIAPAVGRQVASECGEKLQSDPHPLTPTAQKKAIADGDGCIPE